MIPFREAFPYYDLKSVLRGSRYKESLTQKELGNIIGKTQSFISDIENGKIIPDDEVLKLISKAVKLEFEVFKKFEEV